MPAMPDAVLMAPAEFALWAAVLVVAIARTVRVLYRSGNSSGRSEPDALFWNVFTGLVVIVPALLIPAVQSPAVGLLLVILGGAVALLTLSSSRRQDLRQNRKPENRPGYVLAAERHNAVLQKWSRYELDPGNAIEFPGMSDVHVPETAEFFRAMKEAQRCRLLTDTNYPAAVERLEKAFAAAETASCPLSISS
jgi:hypothetical protein